MQLLLNALIAGSLAALLAGGLAFVYGVLNVFNLALGQFALLAGYATWWLHSEQGLPFLPSAGLGLLFGAAVSWLSFEIFVRPFYKRHRFLPLVTTIALSMILDALILLLFGERSRAILPGGKHFVEFADARVSLEQLGLILGTLLLLCGVAFVLHSTRFGRQIRASTQQGEAAAALGISSPLLHRVIFIISGVLAGLGGIYIGIDQVLTPTLGFSLTIKAYAALVAGGKDNLWGTILCAYIIALVEQLAVGVPWVWGAYLPASYQSVVALAFIIVVLLIKPAGLFARSSRAA